ncbi:MAG: Gfo/Idh/MocA family oxidoreductase [Halobacteriovoraceae bacterium]|nr:Gfo/Idh/MocA family oxidoreductase [Halobacteriovoraceae bacterium]
MRVAIIGCGLIGEKRLKAIGKDHIVCALCDTDLERARTLKTYASQNTLLTDDYQKAISQSECDIVIIATIVSKLSEITKFSVDNKKHVIVEKPCGRNFKEIGPILKTAQEFNLKVMAGFNHRFHPAMLKAKEIIDSGDLGELMFLRGRYGHGGRVGYEKEWRANPELSGGGELIDQGVHLIDLSRWYLGDFPIVQGEAHTLFWDMKVDDNAFMKLTTQKQQIAWLHVSCSEWKNMFSLEIYGRRGKIQIEGLGRSYGTEKLTYYKMLPEMGPPETELFEYSGEDLSWNKQFEHFIDCIEQDTPMLGSLTDAYESLKIVDHIYKESSCAYYS